MRCSWTSFCEAHDSGARTDRAGLGRHGRSDPRRTRRAVSSTATTRRTATCRCTFSAASTCCARRFAQPIRTVRPGPWRNWRGSSGVSVRVGQKCGSLSGATRVFAAKAIMALVRRHTRVDYVLGSGQEQPFEGGHRRGDGAGRRRNLRHTGRGGARVQGLSAITRARVGRRERRVVGKAEHLAKGANPRFVVTSLATDDDGGACLVRRTLLRPRRHGKPHQGTAAGAVRRPHQSRMRCVPTSCGCGFLPSPMC